MSEIFIDNLFVKKIKKFGIAIDYAEQITLLVWHGSHLSCENNTPIG